MRKVLILGSTGSIGVQALEVVRGSGELEVVGLSASTDIPVLLDQAREHGDGLVVRGDRLPQPTLKLERIGLAHEG